MLLTRVFVHHTLRWPPSFEMSSWSCPHEGQEQRLFAAQRLCHHRLRAPWERHTQVCTAIFVGPLQWCLFVCHLFVQTLTLYRHSKIKLKVLYYQIHTNEIPRLGPWICRQTNTHTRFAPQTRHRSSNGLVPQWRKFKEIESATQRVMNMNNRTFCID